MAKIKLYKNLVTSGAFGAKFVCFFGTAGVLYRSIVIIVNKFATIFTYMYTEACILQMLYALFPTNEVIFFTASKYTFPTKPDPIGRFPSTEPLFPLMYTSYCAPL